MTHPIPTLRRLAHRFAPVVALLLLVSAVVGGIHHHADGAHDACVLCTAGHGSAVATSVPGPAAAPIERPHAFIASSERAPRPIRLDVPRGRAPPIA
ncbi:MAG: hypothetical protein HYR74_04180 [Candidatus Eisenbacteria bacterium]|nr:hypothetical protein [Candidatus Eisenbacteria bacterium]